MTPKERVRAAVEFKAIDRIPFWPKIDKSYEYKWGRPPSYYHDLIKSDRIAGICKSFSEKRTTTWFEETTNGNEMVTIFGTPHGQLRQVKRFDAPSQSWHPTEFPIKSKDDIIIMTQWVKDAEVVFDKEQHDKAVEMYKSFGDNAFILDSIGQSALMHFVEWLAGVEDGHYLLFDCIAEAEELFEAVHNNYLKRFEISIDKSPADTLQLTENTSTTLISPNQFETYCLPHISAYGKMVRESGRNFMLHMCGHLKRLLPMLNLVSANIFEAFTSPPVGDTTLLDGRLECPDVCLCGGTNAVIWMQSVRDIIAYIEEQLDVLPHHRGIHISSAGVMPPMCEVEKIIAVKEWLDKYPIRV